MTAKERTATGDTKSARTRAAIIDAALQLFRERGYDATTMWAIASAAGVSVGNADSKEQLIQAFYGQIQVDYAAAARPVLDDESELAARIVGVIGAWLGTIEPYRPFAGKFLKNAAEPTSPLSPFSEASHPARTAAVALWREVVEGSSARIPKALRPRLPELLWLYFMGIVLFWVHDPTPGVAASRRIAGRSAPLLVQAIKLTRLRVVRGMLDDLVALLDDVRRFSGPERAHGFQRLIPSTLEMIACRA